MLRLMLAQTARGEAQRGMETSLPLLVSEGLGHVAMRTAERPSSRQDAHQGAGAHQLQRPRPGRRARLMEWGGEGRHYLPGRRKGWRATHEARRERSSRREPCIDAKRSDVPPP